MIIIEKKIPPLYKKQFSMNDATSSEKSSNSYFNNLSKMSIASSNSDTIKDYDKISYSNKRKFTSSSIPNVNFSSNNVVNPIDHLSKSTFLEDLNDYVDKNNEDNRLGIAISSTCTKLNTIPYNSFRTQSDFLNIMNESKSKSKAINYLKLYSSKSIKNSSSDFIFESSTESMKDKDCIIWNKELNINNYSNNYYQINPSVTDDDEEESDPFENISDLTISSDERKQHLSKYIVFFIVLNIYIYIFIIDIMY